MVSRKLGALAKRILAAVVMIPIAVDVLYIGSPYVEVLAVVVGGLLAWEWANLLSTQKSSDFRYFVGGLFYCRKRKASRFDYFGRAVYFNRHRFLDLDVSLF